MLVPRARKSRHAHGRSEVWERPGLARAIEREKARLGRRLRQLREERGLTQEEAAEKMGVHTNHVSRIELGDVNVTLATLVAASEAYGVRMHAFFE